MDNKQFKDIFVSEARDHLDVLNEGLLILEKDPEDEDNINKLFRAFHTLKGNSAALGFMNFSELAHSLEDVLSRIRDKQLNVDQKIMDLILEGCDILEEALDEIIQGDPENIHVEELIHELGKISAKKDEAAVVNISPIMALPEGENAMMRSFIESGNNIFRIIIIFERGNVLRLAKALLIIRNLSEISETISTTPSKDDIKLGKFNSEIELVIATKYAKDHIEKIVHGISGIRHLFVLGKDEKYDKPIETVHEEKELAKMKITDKHKDDAVRQIQSVKVSMGKLDKLMNLVGELLISNIRLQDMSKRQEMLALKSVVTGIDRLTLDLQDEVMEIRMVPIGNIFNRYPRMVRDLANKESKKISLAIEGHEIEFDRTVLDEIGDPLVHLLRNCVDHGIETPQERISLGKPETGEIKLIARREKDNAVIEVVDDGAGIDPEKVKRSSIKKGLITEAEAARMNSNELQMLIFKAGVSTNDVVTEVSGRGVGMDVVLNKVKEMGGDVKLSSEIGKGTSVVMELPLTVAIITALLIKVGAETYAVPLSSVTETVDLDISKVKTVNNSPVFILRGTEVPLYWMHSLLGHEKTDKKKMTVVVANRDNSQVGLVVDSILCQQQVLIKGLQDIVKGTKGVAGATILGDGSVSLILDLRTLL